MIPELRAAWRDIRYALAGVADDNERLTELANYGDVDELLSIAITAAKLGLREQDLAPMARSWYTSAIKMRSLSHRARQYADEIDGMFDDA